MGFQNDDVRKLHWLLTAPNLLTHSPRTPSNSLVDEDVLTSLARENETFLHELDQEPQNLVTWLEPARATRRLGRYLETLASFTVRELLKADRMASNIAIRGTTQNSKTRTLGELDLLFTSSKFAKPQHWELSVKFYLCTATAPDEFVHSRFYMGTFVEDRFDRKLKHLFDTQLEMSKIEEAREELQRRGWDNEFESRALMKGLLFYPSTTDWLSTPTPSELSPRHERGWWTTSDEMAIPQLVRGSKYMRLSPLQWLGRFEGVVAQEDLMSHAELEDEVRRYFGSSLTPAWLRRKELTYAEVRVCEESFNELRVTEVARGHIVHADWPRLAHWSAEQSIDALDRSLRENSKRPLMAEEP